MVSRLVQDLPAPCRRNQLRLTWPPHAPIHAAQGFHRGGRTRRAALLTLWDSVERALVRIAVEEAVQPNDAWDDVSCISGFNLQRIQRRCLVNESGKFVACFSRDLATISAGCDELLFLLSCRASNSCSEGTMPLRGRLVACSCLLRCPHISLCPFDVSHPVVYRPLLRLTQNDRLLPDPVTEHQ